MQVYIVIGTKENVYQETVGGEFLPHPDKQIIRVFSSGEHARQFVATSKLAKPTRKGYGDTSYYRGGYYDMEIESHIIDQNLENN
jgi:hypothetical protein